MSLEPEKFNFTPFIYSLLLLPLIIVTYKYYLESRVNSEAYVGYLIQDGLVAYQNKEFKKSIKIFTEASKFQKDNAAIWNNICANYCEEKEWKKAIESCEKAIKIDPNFQLAKNNLNWALSENK